MNLSDILPVSLTAALSFFLLYFACSVQCCITIILPQTTTG